MGGTEQLWTVWALNDSAQARAIEVKDLPRGAARKRADRLNEQERNLGNGIRFVAIPSDDLPDFLPEFTPQPLAVSEANLTKVPHFRYQWQCSIANQTPSAACSQAKPHVAQGCGYWYFIEMPAGPRTHSLYSLATEIGAIGALSGTPSQITPS